MAFGASDLRAVWRISTGRRGAEPQLMTGFPWRGEARLDYLTSCHLEMDQNEKNRQEERRNTDDNFKWEKKQQAEGRCVFFIV